MRTALVLFVALLFQAVASSAQEPKVWTDADLLKPLPQLHRTADPEVVAALKRKADYIPLMGSSRGSAPARVLPSATAPASRPAVASDQVFYAAQGPFGGFWPAMAGSLYASQPLYPFVTVVYSDRRPARTATLPCPPAARPRR